jgi:hypothetical protein
MDFFLQVNTYAWIDGFELPAGWCTKPTTSIERDSLLYLRVDPSVPDVHTELRRDLRLRKPSSRRFRADEPVNEVDETFST